MIGISSINQPPKNVTQRAVKNEVVRGYKLDVIECACSNLHIPKSHEYPIRYNPFKSRRFKMDETVKISGLLIM